VAREIDATISLGRTYPICQPDWGARVELLEVTIDDGLAMVDFSVEMVACGGGSDRVKAIRDQAVQNVLEFEGLGSRRRTTCWQAKHNRGVSTGSAPENG
jgi:hypothetical protein